MVEYACKKCKYITEDPTICKVCGGKEFSKTWHGFVVVVDPERSEIAKKLGIKYAGKYALIVS